jgi:hypothetical protein
VAGEEGARIVVGATHVWPLYDPVESKHLVQDLGQVQAAQPHGDRWPASYPSVIGARTTSLAHEGCVTANANPIRTPRIEPGGWKTIKQLQQRIVHGVTSPNSDFTARVSASSAFASIVRARRSRWRSASGVMPHTSAASE